MKRIAVLATIVFTAAATGTVAVASSASAAAPQWSASQRACAAAHGSTLACYATYRTRTGRTPAAANAPVEGITATDVATAYALPAGSGYRGTVAIVDAFDEPTAEADLAVYRKRFGLPACTSANGCFRKVNERGKPKPLPEADPTGWGVEIELDLQAVSAACPGCKILLVEGDDPSLDNLGIAVNTAVRLGATVVSNSYGTDEYSGMSAFGARYYRHPGVPIVVSSGDFGFTTASFPAVLPYAIAVGGTTLTRAASTPRGWTEKVVDFASSGCSAYIAKPSWQHDTRCSGRTVADVAAVADNYAVYDSDIGPDSGWIQVGGTSVSAPLIAGMIARSGHRILNNASRFYANQGEFFDITKGSNGFCGGDYLCTGKPGYDAPTGVGTPNGLGGL